MGDLTIKWAIRGVLGVILSITLNVPSVHPRTCSMLCLIYHMPKVLIPPGMTNAQRTTSLRHMTHLSQSKPCIHCIRHVSDNICIFISFCILIDTIIDTRCLTTLLKSHSCRRINFIFMKITINHIFSKTPNL